VVYAGAGSRRMYFIEHRKGRSPLKRETSGCINIEAVLASAKLRAKDIGSDTIVILSRAGRVAGVFSTYSADSARASSMAVGLVSFRKLMAMMPTAAAAIMYQAGAMGLPVAFMTQVMNGWAMPPKTVTATA
jgi:hypothetical protein